jgi:hypothetical protein
VRDKFNADQDNYVSLFETTIRVLGGLLSAYDLSGEAVLLTRAQQIADRLKAAFKTPSGIPRTSVNLHSGDSRTPSWSGGKALLGEC